MNAELASRIAGWERKLDRLSRTEPIWYRLAHARTEAAFGIDAVAERDLERVAELWEQEIRAW